VEVAVHYWYESREARITLGPDWNLQFPTENPTFKELLMAPATTQLLRFDSGKQGAWTEDNGVQWSGFYFNWLPGRVAGYLAKRHTPEICMPATGRKMDSPPELEVVTVKGIVLPIRCYVFTAATGPMYVFHCRWEAGAGAASYVQQESARFNLIRAIWAGRGIHGQKVIEFFVTGIDSATEAKAALIRQLEAMIQIGPSQLTHAK